MNYNIAESVTRVRRQYVELENKTKELFFRCLDEGKDEDYFNTELHKIWGNIDHSYYLDELDEFQRIIHEQNMLMLEISEEPEYEEINNFFELVTLAVILATEKKFEDIKKREYSTSLNSKAYKIDKREYLKLKVQKYTSQIVPYELHKYEIIDGKRVKTDEIIGYSYVDESTYVSMIHNTNLTRTEWNTTLNDADLLGFDLFYIPYHPFSCPHCIEHQNKLMTKEDVLNLVGFAEEAEGDILHPNCKCSLLIATGRIRTKDKLTSLQKAEIYDIRQKVNGLTLKKSRIWTDMKIQKRLGNMEEYDKLNQKINKINEKIKDLKEQLPTEALQKQVTAIKR